VNVTTPTPWIVQTVAHAVRGAPIRGVLIFAVLVMPALFTGCEADSVDSTAKPLSTAVTRTEATAMAENLLAGFDAGDYAAFTRDWSTTLRKGIKETDFLVFRDELMRTSGTFASISDVSLSEADTPGHIKYVFATEFDKGPVTLTITLRRNGEKVEGIFMNSTT
jgi:hypothetical protein